MEAGSTSTASRSAGSIATSIECNGHGRMPGRNGSTSTGRSATPWGVHDFAYAGEVALGRVLCDPTGDLFDLKERGCRIPAAIWRSRRRSPRRRHVPDPGCSEGRQGQDTAYLAGCLSRGVGLCAHAIHANVGRWLINESGAIDASTGLLAYRTGSRNVHTDSLGNSTLRWRLQAALDDARSSSIRPELAAATARSAASPTTTAGEAPISAVAGQSAA